MKTVKKVINKISRIMNVPSMREGNAPESRPPTDNFPPDFDSVIVETIKKVSPATMTSKERIFALCKAVEYIVRNNIPGDIAECGVWKGGSMMAVAYTLLRLQDQSRVLHLFDTFDGMPPPVAVDRSLDGVLASEQLASQNRATSLVWAYSPLEEVRENLHSTGYNTNRMRFIKGKVEDTLPEQAPEQIALLRLDTDWYESTRHEMEVLYPRLQTGGVLIIDDYGHWDGARRAVDEYIGSKRVTILLNRIDYTGRIGVKLSQ